MIRPLAACALVATVAGALIAAGGTALAQPETAPVVKPTVLAEVPHDDKAFTEGLEFDGPALYEGTGGWGDSELRRVDPATGAVLRAAPLPHEYFGEGITVVGDRIWQLTYRDGVAVEWDKASFTPVRQVPLAGEGWGLCRDGDRLIRSDGTDLLRFHDTADLTEIGAVKVTRDGSPLIGLNELECVDGQVWANVWPTDTIVRIEPITGRVNLVVDASGLWKADTRTNAQVLNGIAHIEGSDFLLTGKDWPSAFQVRIDTGGAQ